MDIRVQEADFDLGREIATFGEGRTDIGAVVTFSGLVRDLPEAPVETMEIEHYPGMTERALIKIAKEAMARWDLIDCKVIHRYGRFTPGDQIMMVATAAAHRAAAFAAADFLMDYLKSRAPFWKKEHGPETASWVAAKAEDEAALDRWTPEADG